MSKKRVRVFSSEMKRSKKDRNIILICTMVLKIWVTLSLGVRMTYSFISKIGEYKFKKDLKRIKSR